jgi:O-antigen/teichoic acid export membrane protein
MSVRRHLAWMGIAQGVAFGGQFLTSVVMARLLSPRELGVFIVAASICGVIGIIQALGLAGFIVREPELTRPMKETAFTINLLINAGVAAGIVCAALGSALLFGQPSVARVLLVLAPIPLIGAFEFLPAAMNERSANFKTIALIGLGRTVLSQGIALAFAYCGTGSQSLAFGQLSGASFSAIAYGVAQPREIVLRLRFHDWRRIGSFSLQMLTIYGVNTSASRIADMLLARILGLDALGLFSRASSINNLAWENIHLVVARVLLVRLATLQKTGIALREYYLHTVEVLTALLWPAFLGLAVVSGPFILNLYGRRWVPASYPLVFLALASAVGVSLTMTWELFVVCGETRRQAGIEVVRTGVGTCIFASGAILGGLVGAAAGRFGDALFSACIYRRPIDRMTATTFADLVPIYLRSLLISLVAVGPAGLLMLHHHGTATAPLRQVIASVLVGITLWGVVLAVARHPLAMEIHRMMRRLRA